MDTPILFLIFNRPETSRRVFERIQQVRPGKLYIAGDGPRAHVPQDDQACDNTRQTIVDMIDWPCDLKTLFRKKNLGCKNAVSSAISWFFEQESEGIILEDDCLPDLSFFPFCAELLEKYRHEPRIQMISGNNFLPERHRHTREESYYFSRYVHIWGWATWRRAWRQYDLSMTQWPAYRDRRKLYDFLPKTIAQTREQQFQKAYTGNTTTWDTQWVFACWAAEGLSIQPCHNLVTNIDSYGTHMKIYDPCIHRPTVPVQFPLVHPEKIVRNRRADLYTQRYILLRGWKQTLWLIARHLIRTLCRHPLRLPSDIKTILISILNEYRERRSADQNQSASATASQAKP